jgi:RimJ/RimL family protein N-acetyltransferase
MAVQIKTERLILRYPRMDDASRVFECMQDSELPLNLGRAPYPYSLQDAVDWLSIVPAAIASGDEFVFYMDHPDDGVVGCAGLTRKTETIYEIGYWIGKRWWGNGYATEASRALLQWGRETLGASGFISGYIADNPPSGRVLEKIGFSAVGNIQQYVTGRAREVEAVRLVLDAPAEIALQVPPH